jgi:hypothetical protein
MTEELIDTSHKTSSMTDCITATCQWLANLLSKCYLDKKTTKCQLSTRKSQPCLCGNTIVSLNFFGDT